MSPLCLQFINHELHQNFLKVGHWKLENLDPIADKKKKTALLYDPNHIYEKSFTLSDEKKKV